jgi:Mg-chelatase subunit ChlI
MTEQKAATDEQRELWQADAEYCRAKLARTQTLRHQQELSRRILALIARIEADGTRISELEAALDEAALFMRRISREVSGFSGTTRAAPKGGDDD